jgi:uncharacterized protein (DUF983 family)
MKCNRCKTGKLTDDYNLVQCSNCGILYDGSVS